MSIRLAVEGDKVVYQTVFGLGSEPLLSSETVGFVLLWYYSGKWDGRNGRLSSFPHHPTLAINGRSLYRMTL
jgi:hypothetical protein